LLLILLQLLPGMLQLANKLLLVVLGLSSQSTRCRHNQTAAAAAVPFQHQLTVTLLIVAAA
jgi:hypothetical protein